MMMAKKEGISGSVDQIRVEMMGLLNEPMPVQRWVSPRQHKIWRPPTDVYETDDCITVKVEIAGMAEGDFALSLENKALIITGVRRDPASKLGYQQMEILYGHFETHVHVPKSIDEENIEATYHNGFLVVRLPKAQPHHVPIITPDE
jgi:HSP20 family protein